MKYKSILLGLMLAAGLTATAQVTDKTTDDDVNPHTTVGQERVLPRVTSKIKLLTRTYGDSIVLRWMPEDFVSYNYLKTFGVNVLRITHDTMPGLHVDTLAYALKPLKFDEFRNKYPTSDSLALVAMNVLFGEGENESRAKGYMAGREDISNSQDINFAFGMLVCEWRKDLAKDMAVRFTDRNVKPGMTYSYIIQPAYWDPNGSIIFEPGAVDNVKNKPFVQRPYNPIVTDSLCAPFSVMLKWNDDRHSSFEVERHKIADEMAYSLPETPWERVTKKPYLSMVAGENEENLCVFIDTVPSLGVWSYRLLTYDSFGELVPPVGEHSVMVRDILPPAPPVLKYIVIERPDSTDLMSKVIAHVVWEKDSLEDDLAGYRIFYQPSHGVSPMWQPMNYDLIAPKDTILALDMTGKRTGMMYVAAYDHAGNESNSFVQQIRLTDFKAPAPPDSLRAVVRDLQLNEDSTAIVSKWVYVDLYWQPKAEDDDISYFDVSFANDTTHVFLLRNRGGIPQSTFTDSMVVNANQKYIYYRVRAVDYSTNMGEWTPWIQVERPHITPPSEPHLGKSSHSDEEGMYMEWIVGADADMKRHIVYRRLGESGSWDIVGKFDADSVKAAGNKIIINDNPPYSQTERYYYFAKSVNSSPFVARSKAVSWKHHGPRVLKLKTELSGIYDEEGKETRLGWNTEEDKLPEGDWYWAIYRKGPDDSKFRYHTSANKDDRSYTEKTLHPGETAEYYICIQFGDGRHSPDSNTVSVTATKDNNQ